MRFQFEGDERTTLIARFGLQPSATDAEIGARVQSTLLAADNDPPPAVPASDPGESTEPPATPPTTPGGDPGVGGVGGNPADPSQSPSPTSEPPREEDDDDDDVNASGQVVVDVQAFRDLNARAAQAEQLERDALNARRDQLIAAAVADGRFPPARKEHYAKLFDLDPDGTERSIKRLAKNVVPLAARGVEASDEDVATDDYPKHWLTGGAQPSEPVASANGAGSARQNRIHTED